MPTGAITGVTSIATPEYIDFNITAPDAANAAGRLYWNSDDNTQTLQLGLAGGNVIYKLGEELYFRIKASSAITKGQTVMFTGTLGSSGGITGAPTTGLLPDQASYVIGVAAENINLNAWGYVTYFGEIKGLDTDGGTEAWVDGQVLYNDPTVPGGLSKNPPNAPNAKVQVAAVVHAASTNGIILVRPTYGSVLGGTDGNVQFTGLTGGNMIVYDSALGYWKNSGVNGGTF
jgi:hypothetical protein